MGAILLIRNILRLVFLSSPSAEPLGVKVFGLPMLGGFFFGIVLLRLPGLVISPLGWGEGGPHTKHDVKWHARQK